MTIPQTTFFPTTEGAVSGLTRLRMADEIYSSRHSAGHETGPGFIIIQRSDFTTLPRPRGPRRLAAGRTG
jgi:hypothetical protein